MSNSKHRASVIETSKTIETPTVYANPKTNYAVIKSEENLEDTLMALQNKTEIKKASFVRSAARKRILEFLSQNEKVKIENAVYRTPSGEVITDNLHPLEENISKVTIKKLQFKFHQTPILYTQGVYFSISMNKRSLLTEKVLPQMFGDSAKHF